MSAIWEIGLWFGGFLVFFLAFLFLMKLIDIIQILKQKMENQGAKLNGLNVLRTFPIFIVALPIIWTMINIFEEADSIGDFAISATSYRMLIVEMAPAAAALVLVWTIFYMFAIIYYDSEGLI